MTYAYVCACVLSVRGRRESFRGKANLPRILLLQPSQLRLRNDRPTLRDARLHPPHADYRKAGSALGEHTRDIFFAAVRLPDNRNMERVYDGRRTLNGALPKDALSHLHSTLTRTLCSRWSDRPLVTSNWRTTNASKTCLIQLTLFNKIPRFHIPTSPVPRQKTHEPDARTGYKNSGE